jgi:hypothetical protein
MGEDEGDVNDSNDNGADSGAEEGGQPDGFREPSEFREPLKGDEWKGSKNPAFQPILPPASPPKGVEPGDATGGKAGGRHVSPSGGYFLDESADVPDRFYTRAEIEGQKRRRDAKDAARRMRDELDRRMRGGEA